MGNYYNIDIEDEGRKSRRIYLRDIKTLSEALVKIRDARTGQPDRVFVLVLFSNKVEIMEHYYKTTITFTFSHKGKIPPEYNIDQILEAGTTETSVQAWTMQTLPCTEEEAKEIDIMDFQPLPEGEVG